MGLRTEAEKAYKIASEGGSPSVTAMTASMLLHYFISAPSEFPLQTQPVQAAADAQSLVLTNMLASLLCWAACGAHTWGLVMVVPAGPALLSAGQRAEQKLPPQGNCQTGEWASFC